MLSVCEESAVPSGAADFFVCYFVYSKNICIFARGKPKTMKHHILFLLVSFFFCTLASAQTKNYDINRDKQLNEADVTVLSQKILGGLKVREDDLDGNNTITIGDEVQLIDALQKHAVGAHVYALQKAIDNTSPAYMVTEELPSLGESDLKNLLTTLTIDVSAISNVESVSVFANGKEVIAGPMNYSFVNGQLSLSAGNKTTYASSVQSDVVRVVGSGVVTAYLLPVDLKNGVTVTVRTKDEAYYSQKFADAIPASSQKTLKFTNTSADHLWMATLPGNSYITMLSTPSAHDACTDGCSSITAFAAKTQEDNLATMLAKGVRGFDLRPTYTGSESSLTIDNMTIYHGIASTGVKFKDAMNTIINFVRNHPTECAVVFLQQESSSGTAHVDIWRNTIRNYLAENSDYLVPRIDKNTTLDDCRGKVLVLTRNEYWENYFDIVYGAYCKNWSDNTSSFNGYLLTQYGTRTCNLNIEDTYKADTDTKQPLVKTMLTSASGDTNANTFYVTHTSIQNTSPFSSIAAKAKTLNATTKTLIDGLSGRLGVVMSDYITDSSNNGTALLHAITAQNHKYIWEGRQH